MPPMGDEVTWAQRPQALHRSGEERARGSVQPIQGQAVMPSGRQADPNPGRRAALGKACIRSGQCRRAARRAAGALEFDGGVAVGLCRVAVLLRAIRRVDAMMRRMIASGVRGMELGRGKRGQTMTRPARQRPCRSQPFQWKGQRQQQCKKPVQHGTHRRIVYRREHFAKASPIGSLLPSQEMTRTLASGVTEARELPSYAGATGFVAICGYLEHLHEAHRILAVAVGRSAGACDGDGGRVRDVPGWHRGQEGCFQEPWSHRRSGRWSESRRPAWPQRSKAQGERRRCAGRSRQELLRHPVLRELRELHGLPVDACLWRAQVHSAAVRPLAHSGAGGATRGIPVGGAGTPPSTRLIAVRRWTR